MPDAGTREPHPIGVKPRAPFHSADAVEKTRYERIGWLLPRGAAGGRPVGPPILHRRPACARLQLVRNVILEEYRRASSLTSSPVKATLIGPDKICQRFAHEASRAVYEDTDAFLADVVAIERAMIQDLVDAGCRYVQIDDPCYTAYVDEPSLEQMRRRGEDPEPSVSRPTSQLLVPACR